MKTRFTLTLPVIFAALLFSCSKNNDLASSDPSKLEKMSAADAMAIAETDTTGFDGAMACYHTYFGTIEHPPTDYIPGSGEIDLNTCLSAYNGSSGGGAPTKMMPPAPKAVLSLAPPSTSTDDNMAYRRFFGVGTIVIIDGSFGSRTLDEAKVIFDRYCNIVCNAVTENITFPDPSYVDKAAAGVIYATNHPEVFQSAEDKETFLRFLSLVFSKPQFVISTGRGAIDTGGIIWLPSASCVNLKIKFNL